MKQIFLLIGFIYFLSCSNKVASDNTKDISLLRKYVEAYQPKQINAFADDSLNKFNFENIFNKQKIDVKIKDEVVNVLLLKQYLYHLTTSNQSYNLLDFRKDKSKLIIGYFFKEHLIDTNVEFLSSSVPYNILKKEKKHSENVEDLLHQINNQELRVEKYTDSIINLEKK